jgi:His Kinase A (phospho-acceptor) domain/GAF domain
MLISDQNLDANLHHPIIIEPLRLDPSIITDLSNSPLTNFCSDPNSGTEATLADGQLSATQIFTEATTQAVRLVKAPVAILMTTGRSGCQINSIAGLEKLVNLPAQPNLPTELTGLAYCYAQVMSCERRFWIHDCQEHSQLAQLPLVQVHGVRAYLGLPIITAAKDRLGVIAILDFKPRQFNNREIELLNLIGRLVASEFERKLLSQAKLNSSIDQLEYWPVPSFDDAIAAAEHQQETSTIDDHYLVATVDTDFPDLGSPLNAAHAQVPAAIQAQVLTNFAQELRTPLTSILGMASVLQQEIYGALSGKQKDYVGIIYQSGQKLVSIVDEISQVGKFNGTATNFDQDQSLVDSLIDRSSSNLPLSNSKPGTPSSEEN